MEETQSKTAGGVGVERCWDDFIVTGLYSASGFAFIPWPFYWYEDS